MCGLVGAYSFSGTPLDPLVLSKMMALQRHRGPDDHGARLFSLRTQTDEDFRLNDPPVNSEFEGGVGFNRLSILDVSPEGHQPMRTPDGQIFIAYNGEVYNAFDYVDELTSAGYRFHSHTDTEVLLYLYQEHGIEGMLERLNGMFAFCIVDLREQAIYLARDRIGIKPLYWYLHENTLLFSSETKSFLAHPAFQPELNPDVLDEFFAFRYLAAGQTLLKHVQELQPGHWMRVTPNDHSIHRYWSVPQRQIASSHSMDESAEIIEHELRRSVKQRLLSDVPLGAQLSGGVDSSLVNLFAAESAPEHFDAFSIVVNDPKYSEERWIDQAASVAGVDVHKTTMGPEYFADQFEEATWLMDQPLNLPNSVAVYQLAEMAKPLVTVLLSGEGADELLGGYPKFFTVAVRQRLRLPLALGRSLPLLRNWLGNRPGIAFPGADDVRRLVVSGSFLTHGQLTALRPASTLESVSAKRMQVLGPPSKDLVTDALRYDMQVYLVDLLTRQDKMTMAHSVENRVPFLDHQLIERVFELPVEHLVDWKPRSLAFNSRDRLARHSTKLALKRLAARHFGKEFAYREKEGLSVPLANYLVSPRFRSLVEERLLPGIRQRGIVNAEIVEEWWAAAVAGAPTPILGLWISFAFETWAQLILDGGWRDAAFVETSHGGRFGAGD